NDAIPAAGAGDGPGGARRDGPNERALSGPGPDLDLAPHRVDVDRSQVLRDADADPLGRVGRPMDPRPHVVVPEDPPVGPSLPGQAVRTPQGPPDAVAEAAAGERDVVGGGRRAGRRYDDRPDGDEDED